MAKEGDMEKLNLALGLLDQTDLGLSLVWLWTWSIIKDAMNDEEWDVLMTEKQAWDRLCKAVKRGYGFSLEYGAEQHYEDTIEWMNLEGIIEGKAA